MRDDLDRAIETAFMPEPPARLAVAVSGGGDSMALLLLLNRLAATRGTTLSVVTVDHGLRPEAKEEVRLVASACAQFGLSHQVLNWSGWDGSGNLQDAARRARYRMISEWAQANDIPAVALAHTMNDQAETVLMRMRRASGVDGLSAMSARQMRHDILWLRPLLRVTRDALRDVLRSEGIEWAEDPSNSDARFDRVKARRALAELAPLGVTVEALAQTAQNMAMARAALEAQTRKVIAASTQVRAGAIALDPSLLAQEPLEIQRRVYLACLNWITGADYAPRAKTLDAARQALAQQGAATIDGCHMRMERGLVWIFREYEPVRALRCDADQNWDTRWRILGPPEHAEVAALGPDGLAVCSDWRAAGVPRPVLLSTPAVWKGTELVAAPVVEALLGRSSVWRAELKKRGNAVFDAAETH